VNAVQSLAGSHRPSIGLPQSGGDTSRFHRLGREAVLLASRRTLLSLLRFTCVSLWAVFITSQEKTAALPLGGN
jgi:hypothetical protein